MVNTHSTQAEIYGKAIAQSPVVHGDASPCLRGKHPSTMNLPTPGFRFQQYSSVAEQQVMKCRHVAMTGHTRVNRNEAPMAVAHRPCPWEAGLSPSLPTFDCHVWQAQSYELGTRLPCRGMIFET